MPFAPLNDISIYYELRGASGSPVILIMGLGASKLGWPIQLVNAMAARHRVILFDNRGAGQTGWPPGPYTMSQFAADTVGLLDALAIGKAHVFGVSMGGMIAQHVALNHPDRVLGLVLGCTAAGGAHIVRTPPDALEILTRPRSDNRAADIRAAWPIFYTPRFIEAHRDLLEKQLALVLAYPEQPRFAFELQLGAIVQTHNTFDRLKEIAAPTLIQTGLQDTLIPPGNAHILAGQIPGARVIEYPGAGHAYFLEAWPAAVNDVLAFLAEVDG
ncbi:MAG: alpha/beta fold hydrolase [Anaerolineae bacterium]